MISAALTDSDKCCVNWLLLSRAYVTDGGSEKLPELLATVSAGDPLLGRNGTTVTKVWCGVIQTSSRRHRVIQTSSCHPDVIASSRRHYVIQTSFHHSDVIWLLSGRGLKVIGPFGVADRRDRNPWFISCDIWSSDARDFNGAIARAAPPAPVTCHVSSGHGSHVGHVALTSFSQLPGSQATYRETQVADM